MSTTATTFHMSERTANLVRSSLDGLDDQRRKGIIEALSAVAAEIEIYCTAATMRKLRQDWSDCFSTMTMLSLKEPRK